MQTTFSLVGRCWSFFFFTRFLGYIISFFFFFFDFISLPLWPLCSHPFTSRPIPLTFVTCKHRVPVFYSSEGEYFFFLSTHIFSVSRRIPDLYIYPGSSRSLFSHLWDFLCCLKVVYFTNKSSTCHFLPPSTRLSHSCLVPSQFPRLWTSAPLSFPLKGFFSFSSKQSDRIHSQSAAVKSDSDFISYPPQELRHPRQYFLRVKRQWLAARICSLCKKQVRVFCSHTNWRLTGPLG